MSENPDPKYEAKHLFRTLKKILKEKKISYRELATQVSFSEGTIKNIFHFDDASVERVCEIAQAIGLPFQDLVAAAYSHQNSEFSFTQEQERFFAEKPGHYNFFRALFFLKKSAEEIRSMSRISRRSTEKYLRELEAMGFLERHLRDKVTFKVSGRLKWAPGGPWMQKFFRTYSAKITDLILGRSNSADYFCSFSFATLSRANRDLFYLEIQEVVEKYKDISYKEYLVGVRDAVPVSWMFSMVPEDVVSHREDIPELN